LDRALPVLRTSPDEVEFAVENLDARCRQLEGELGTYRPVSFLSRGVQVGEWSVVALFTLHMYRGWG
jgi:hypothetical protein